jgi:hypothetical protein
MFVEHMYQCGPHLIRTMRDASYSVWSYEVASQGSSMLSKTGIDGLSLTEKQVLTRIRRRVKPSKQIPTLLNRESGSSNFRQF